MHTLAGTITRTYMHILAGTITRTCKHLSVHHPYMHTLAGIILSPVHPHTCRYHHPYMHTLAGTITRTCTNGTWSPLDYSGCSFNAEQVDSRAFMLIWIPLAVDEPQLTSALPQVKAEARITYDRVWKTYVEAMPLFNNKKFLN